MNDKNFIAHTYERENKILYQTIFEHSTNVAELTQKFSANFCSGDVAYNLGLLHDIGKYQSSFQRRIRGESIKIEHAICGAEEIENNENDIYGLKPGKMGAFVISGHHSGLPNLGTKVDREDEKTLFAKLKRKTEDYSKFKIDLPLKIIDDKKVPFYKIYNFINKENLLIDLAFWIRMMFSCLTDADFLDTEKFCNNSVDREIKADFKACYDKLQYKFSSFKSNSKVISARNEYRKEIISNADKDSEIYFMNMPTGSGKTLASMEFALTRAIRKNKDRIIYVIPYTSIIEQNAKVFKDVFGEEIVLEHHCNFDYETINDYLTREKLRLSSENWDIPIVVTTNVQFFESIYANKSSHLRKLHNISNSIIVFDEVHMFPANFYESCLQAIRTLVKQYNCEALFLSATMPNFDKWLLEFNCKGISTQSLLRNGIDKSIFKRCDIQNLGKIEINNLIYEVTQKRSVLIVVNKRQTARDIYDKLSGNKYHLSTYMTHFDRDRVIGEVREKLKNNEQVYLVSTSLIEAGVDLDFDYVYRELAGLDNLLQSAGRCNREGLKQNCLTFAFELDGINVQSNLKIKQFICRQVFENFKDVSSDDAIEFYFDKLFTYQKQEMNQLDLKEYFNGLKFDFECFANKFKLINENTESIVIITNENRNEIEILLNKIENGNVKARRNLQKYVISLYSQEMQKLIDNGVITQKFGLNLLENANFYSKEIGIKFEDDTTYLF